MEIKTVNRTIHPETHESKNAYRVKIGKRNYYDVLVVNISHESWGLLATYEFDGKTIAPYESIHFKAREEDGRIVITWVQDLPIKKMKFG